MPKSFIKRVSLAATSILAWIIAGEAKAYTNTIQIRVTRDRLWQCGNRWDPEGTGRWSGARGRIYLNGQLVRQYDLTQQAECDKVTTVSLEAGKDQEIQINLVNEFGEHLYKRYTVAADRLWEFNFFSDSYNFVDVSTNWGSSQKATTGPIPQSQPVSSQGGNLALGKPTGATGAYSIYIASRGNDGDPTTIWNGGGHRACWSVDLQRVYALSSVEVSSNQFGDSGLQTIFQVQITKDKSTWWLLGPQYTARGNQTFAIPANGAQARFIGYCTLPGTTQWATLGELKAFGMPAPR